MALQISIDETALAGENPTRDGTHEILPDLAYQRLAVSNVAFVGLPGSDDWVLVDAGVMKMAHLIAGAAKARFGDKPPRAIVMTHGHFDHFGSLEALLETWKVPIFVHELEAPYFNGSASYPPPDPGVGGGLMSLLSPLYPRGPVDVGDFLQILPSDGSVPFLPGWTWLHTPGHTPGHVSFWRGSDKTLIAGDAFITTAQESAYSVAAQKPEMHGPPMYFTQDFKASRHSVEKLAALEPLIAITGHGPALSGPILNSALHQLSRDFEEVAVPHGRKYADHPAKAEDGSAYDAV
ncbi:Glyoxylase, beta-lactamase superfamily II [Abditibacterium utsteinense]|uniref:Glyoxylase, beta-lactamase superfamily II n=1 Tax=Abditibacterium utsteinense TaxID=1960156 RepID=A0A2S8SVR0_9BACT|nr:MBL fold metallo-hydrolase [Abditibacterium utsteinense]PQV64881.1 Glyoxylase, beta-lactamase superfamily II [Abditibacterium utsteinense]